MRAKLLGLTILAAVVATGAYAAQAPNNTFMSKQQIMGLIDKAKADRKGDAPNTIEPILTMAPYRAQLEYRTGAAPAAVHEKDAELMIVLQGQGNIIVGGKLVNEKRNNANNLGGDSITGGENPCRRRRRFVDRSGKCAASGHPNGRCAHRADDDACARSAAKLAAGKLISSGL
jgi:hypothetical protein